MSTRCHPSTLGLTVAAITPSSVAFTWDPVADRGDGVGRDYFAAGLDHYVSWLTVGDRPERLQLASTAAPRSVSLAGMRPLETACLHVQAVDRVQNSTADQGLVRCAARSASDARLAGAGKRRHR